MSSRRTLLLAALMLAAAPLPFGSGTAAALPGNCYVVLSPAAEVGSFDVDDYLQDPGAWPSLAAEHPDGWSVVYRSATPPPGWQRPFTLRGGGMAGYGGGLHPRYAVALGEMLPVRTAAMVAQRSAPDPAACHPGQPNPHPLTRDGWLFLHDGWMDIETVTLGIWRADLGPGWEGFKAAHPRDYNGNADSSRGNAGEIYFLALLHEIEATPDDIPDAFLRLMQRIVNLPGWTEWQLNAILQNAAGTWAFRWALQDPAGYPIHFTRTTAGEHCIVDSLPGGGSGWESLPNFALGVFPAGGAAEVITFPIAAVPGSPDLEGGGPRRVDPDPIGGPPSPVRLAAATGPSRGQISLHYEIPGAAVGLIDVWDALGRHRARLPVAGGSGVIRWEPPADCHSGLFLTRLSVGRRQSRARVLLLR